MNFSVFQISLVLFRVVPYKVPSVSIKTRGLSLNINTCVLPKITN